MFSFIGFTKSSNKLNKIEELKSSNIHLLSSFKKSFVDLINVSKDYVFLNDEVYKKEYETILNIHLGKSPLPKNYDFTYTELALMGQKEKKDFESDLGFDKRFLALKLVDQDKSNYEYITKKRDLLLNLQNKSISLVSGENSLNTVDKAKAMKILKSEDYLIAKKEILVSLNKLFESFVTAPNEQFKKINGQLKFFKVLFIFSFIVLILNLIAIFTYINGAIIGAIEKLKYAMQAILAGKEQEESSLDKAREDEIGDINKAVLDFKANASKLKDLNLELEEFNFKTADGIRGPLLASLGLVTEAESALEDNNIEKLTQTLNMLKDSLNKLENLIHDVMSVNKTQTQVEEDSQVDLDKLIEDEHLKLSHMPNYDKVDIVTTFFTPTQLYIKKSRLQLIVANFISNAIKYANVDKARSYLRIKTFEKDGLLVFEFKDNGLGIPEQHQAKVFNMFCRFHPSVAYGSGLGLYMIKKSADVLNANVIYEPHGEGSIFRLEVPGGMKALEEE
ncbi:MAG: HAMP domain-containing histidine kinase [Candidatus Caenarcaniphilales bacterium]|nr:HAMP domain-containing histidine kinase [Candidatus Caenarcaniphilales bacterium]